MLATSVAQTITDIPIEVMDMHALWMRSVYCPVAARLPASKCDIHGGERLFVAGLLRDIGHLVMYQSCPVESADAVLRTQIDNRTLHAVERELLGFDYAELGGALLKQWGLPASRWEPVQFHMLPDQSTDYLLESSIVHLAGVLSEIAQDDALECDAFMPLVHPFAGQAVGLTTEQYAEVRVEVDSQLDDVMFMIFPGSKTVHPGSRLEIGV